MSAGVDAVAQKEPVLKEWQEIKNLVEAEAAEAKAQEKSEAEQVDAGSSGSARASAVAAGSEQTLKNDMIILDNLAKEHVRAYVKLLPEPTSIEGVTLAVKQSSVSTLHGQEQRNVFMISLSVDSLGEVAGRVLHRRPPVEFDVLRKLVQGALLGRGGQRESDEYPVRVPPGDIVSLHDGGRPNVQSMFMDLWKPTHKLLGSIVKHSAVDVKMTKSMWCCMRRLFAS